MPGDVHPRQGRLIPATFAVLCEVRLSYFFRWDEFIVLFRRNADSFFALFEFEKGNDTLRHELCADGLAYQRREFARTYRHVLLDLNHVQLIASSLRLDGEDIVGTFLIHADVDFIGFDLTDIHTVVRRWLWNE